MELMGYDQEEAKRKNNKIMKWIIIAIVIFLVITIGLFATIYYLQATEFKFIVDNTNVAMTEDLFIFEDDTIYVSIKDIAPIVGYKYYNGGYKQYSEDVTKCYLESKNEVCTFEKDSNIIYKTPADEIDYEYYTISTPVKYINEKLYVTAEGISLACNLKISYQKSENTIIINTLDYYTNYYTQKYTTAAISNDFNNQKALLYGLLVVKNVDQNGNLGNRYGIITLNGQEVVGTKYTDIDFIESTQEFIVRTEEGKVGIITSSGVTKVSPQYDDLKQIDKNLNLYLATNNNKKGVIEKNGKILIYLEYDEIGIDTTQFSNNDIKNPYLLFDNAIPVKQNGKWGMYDKRGNLILPIEYEGFGCTINNTSVNNILIIPEVKGIVVSKTYQMEKERVTLYGIVNYLGKDLVPAALQTVYSTINNGRETYTMIYNGTSYNVIDYIYEWVDLESVNQDVSTNVNNIEESQTQLNEII